MTAIAISEVSVGLPGVPQSVTAADGGIGATPLAGAAGGRLGKHAILALLVVTGGSQQLVVPRALSIKAGGTMDAAQWTPQIMLDMYTGGVPLTATTRVYGAFAKASVQRQQPQRMRRLFC